MEFYITEKGFKTNLEYGELSISPDEDHGFRPFQLLISSIVGCSGSVFRSILAKQRVEIDDMTIQAKVERNDQEANRIEKITLNYIVKGKDLNSERMERNLNLSRKHCSMIRSVEDSIEIVETLELIE